MAQTMREVVTMLQQANVAVKYRVRKDGGIRITSINGARFTGSTGNKQARIMAGVELSERRAKQLKTIKSAKGQWGHQKRVKAIIDEETKARIRAVQRVFRKNKIKGRGGTITQKNYRYALRHYGKAEADRRLAQAEKYAQGLAYGENVDALYMRIEMDLNKRKSAEMKEISNKIKLKRDSFKEEWINKIYEVLYLWEKRRMNSQEASSRINRILNS